MNSYMFIGALCAAITSALGILFWDSQASTEVINAGLKESSITFILGDDSSGESEYYDRAVEYFTLNPHGQTDYIIRSVRSIGGIIQYLNQIGENQKVHWSEVNVVVHGNPHTGLRTSLYDNGPRATPKRLMQALLTDTMPTLNGAHVSGDTQINIYSCGVGVSKVLKWTLQRVFKPDQGDSPSVYCSEHFIVFHPSLDGSVMNLIKADYYPYYYKRGYRPSQSEIITEMKRQYPEQKVDWQDALATTQQLGTSSFNNEFHIPVKYVKVYKTKDARPRLDSIKEKMTWIKNQPELVEAIESSGIDSDKFHWQVDRVIHTQEDGSQVPAVRAIGMSTVLCVLQPVNSDELKT